MEGMKNIIKEVDLQIVHRRLQARKRNIKADGKLSKQHLASAYRGYHGLESQYHALLRMSDDSFMHTKLRNDRLLFKHIEEMKNLSEQEKIIQKNSAKEIKAMREDFTAQLAYQYVYRNNSFKQYAVSKTAKLTRPFSDKPEFYDTGWREHGTQSSIRPLGSLRQTEVYKDELKLKFSPINNSDIVNDLQLHKVNMMEDKTYKDLKMESKEGDQEKFHTTFFPNIESAMGVQCKHNYQSQLDDKATFISAPAGAIDGDSEVYSDTDLLLTRFDMGHNLLQMREKEREKYAQRRVLPSTPCVQNKVSEDIKKQSFPRVLPQTPRKLSTLYPGKAKNYSSFKKMLDNEARGVINSWTSDTLKAELAELYKNAHTATLQENPIPGIDILRTTSAIFRDFEKYKKLQEERKAAQFQNEDDESIVISKMSHFPRLDSPTAHRRSEYKNVPITHQKRDESPTSTNFGKFRRRTTEMFPSVSRSTSLRDVFDQPIDLHEKSKLTAAERIELEKLIRDQKAIEQTENKGKREQENVITVQLTPKRHLTPRQTSEQNVHNTKAVLKQMKREAQMNMSASSILHRDEEIEMINEVKLANTKHEKNEDVSVSERRAFESNMERLRCDPNAREVESSVAEHVPFASENFRQLSDLYGQDIRQKLTRKMQSNYESSVRFPDMKTLLDIRARNKRKIRLNNANLTVESKQKQRETTGTERPPTRVSFNEDVIVYQAL